MPRMTISVLFAVMGLSLVACGQTEAEKQRQARLASMTPQERHIQEVLDRRCVKCHMPPGAKKNLDLTDPVNLLPLIKSDLIFDDIAVYNMLMGDSSIVEHQRGEYQLKQNEIDMIRRWVLTEHPEHGPQGVRAPTTSFQQTPRPGGDAG